MRPEKHIRARKSINCLQAAGDKTPQRETPRRRQCTRAQRDRSAQFATPAGYATELNILEVTMGANAEC